MYHKNGASDFDRLGIDMLLADFILVFSFRQSVISLCTFHP